MKINPQTLVQQLTQAAAREIQATANNETLSRAEKNRLSPALREAADAFMTGKTSVKAKDFIEAFKTSLEHDLRRSLQTGQLMRADVTPRVQELLSESNVGTQVLARLANEQALSVADAQNDVARALATATAAPRSQITVFRALGRLEKVLRAEGQDPNAAKQVKDRMTTRKKQMRDAVNAQVKVMEGAFKETPNAQNADGLRRAIQEAFDTYSVVAPTSSRIKTLTQRATALGFGLTNDAARVQPFFARFLENQNRAGAQGREVGNEARTVTEKAPSDAEDGGAGDVGNIVTEKAPSDAEDGGADVGGVTTAKFPSDNEDGGAGDVGNIVTEKAPSDAEDGGAGDVGGAVTAKFPSRTPRTAARGTAAELATLSPKRHRAMPKTVVQAMSVMWSPRSSPRMPRTVVRVTVLAISGLRSSRVTLKMAVQVTAVMSATLRPRSSPRTMRTAAPVVLATSRPRSSRVTLKMAVRARTAPATS